MKMLSMKIPYYDDDVSARKLEPIYDDERDGLIFVQRRGCCFWIACFGSRHPSSPELGSWNRIPFSDISNKDLWWNRGWKKVREWSELVAGPKWKTFIRRFKKQSTKSVKRYDGNKFNYDAASYSLNFDDGPGQPGNLDDDFLYRDFSCRYAAIPVSAKSSMDLGKDAPSFT